MVINFSVTTGIGDDLWLVYHPGILPGYSGPLSLATPLWVAAMIPAVVSTTAGEETASFV